MITARCLCGAVTYSTDAEPVDQVVCHCADCQRQTGSPFAVFVGVPRAGFRCEGGTLWPRSRRPARIMAAKQNASSARRAGRPCSVSLRSHLTWCSSWLGAWMTHPGSSQRRSFGRARRSRGRRTSRALCSWSADSRATRPESARAAPRPGRTPLLVRAKRSSANLTWPQAGSSAVGGAASRNGREMARPFRGSWGLGS